MSRPKQGLANGRWKHEPRLTPKQVLEARHRVLYGDLKGKSLKTVGRTFFVGPGEMAQALGGLGRYGAYPTENIITDRKFLLNCIPNSQVDVTQRVVFMQEKPEIEALVIQQAQAIEEDVVEYEPKETNVVASTEGIVEPGTGVADINDITDITEPAGAGRAEERGGRGGDRSTVRIDVSAETIAQIRADRSAGVTYPALVAKYGLSNGMIDRIVRGKGRFGKMVPLVKPEPASEPASIPAPIPTRPSAEALLETLLHVAAPQLGWAKLPEGPKLGEILTQLEAAHELLGETIALLRTWADAFEGENTHVT